MTAQGKTLLTCEPANVVAIPCPPPTAPHALQERLAVLRVEAKHDAAAQASLIECLLEISRCQVSAGQDREAREALVEAAAELRGRLTAGDRGIDRMWIGTKIQLGYLCCALNEGDQALPHLSECIDFLESKGARDRDLVAALNAQASAFTLMRKGEDALSCLQKAEVVAGAIAMESKAADDTYNWAMILNSLGRTQLEGGLVSPALYSLTRCIDISGKLVEFSADQKHRNLRAAAVCRLGTVHESLKEFALAERCYRESVSTMQNLVEAEGATHLSKDLQYAQERLALVRGMRLSTRNERELIPGFG